MAATSDLGVGWLLGAVHRRVRALWAERIRDLGVTPPQAAALRELRRRPDVSLRELARLLEAEPINLSRALKPLEARGLVERHTRSDDRRVHALRLTPDGADLADRLDAASVRFEAELAPQLSPPVELLHDALRCWLATLQRSERGPRATEDS